MEEKELAAFLSGYQGRPLRLMEVCGTHTSALYRTGLRQILSPRITLLSGPGCPVCVTPTAYIDRLVEYAFRPGHKVMAFGDMLAVPGSELSLAQARDKGGRADFFYTPEAVLEQAAADPGTCYILAAVGFETTAPVWAALLRQAVREGLRNVLFLTALKTMPQALRSLCGEGRIDGFLCPGHVAVVTGSEPFAALAEEFSAAMVIGGFTRRELLRAMVRLVLTASRKQSGLWNEYPSVVRPGGNPLARQITAEMFEEGPAVWRGLGRLEHSGLYIKEEWRDWDGGSRGLDSDRHTEGCLCSRILCGQALPAQCPFFGKRCVPGHPVGACMVSSEGSCSIAWREGGSPL